MTRFIFDYDFFFTLFKVKRHANYKFNYILFSLLYYFSVIVTKNVLHNTSPQCLQYTTHFKLIVHANTYIKYGNEVYGLF